MALLDYSNCECEPSVSCMLDISLTEQSQACELTDIGRMQGQAGKHLQAAVQVAVLLVRLCAGIQHNGKVVLDLRSKGG